MFRLSNSGSGLCLAVASAGPTLRGVVPWGPEAWRALPLPVLGNQPFLVDLSFSLREWLSKPAERTNTIVLLNTEPTGQERVSALACFHFIKEKEPFPGVGEHCLYQPQLPWEAPLSPGES